MSSLVNTLLEELYALEPSLRTKEDTIKKLIKAMLAKRPDIEIDTAFRAELREKIMREIAPKRSSPLWLQWWPMLGAFSLCLVFGVWFSENQSKTIGTVPLSFAQNIQEVGRESFGPIALTGANQAARPQSGGGGGLGGGGDTISSKMIAPDTMIYPPMDIPIYTYTYKGEVELPEDLPVYKKTNVPFTSSDTSNIVNNLSLQDINMRAFKNLGISNLTLTEDIQYGYMLTLDFVNGTISMYQNYMRWPQPVCDKNGCNLSKLTEKDIPSDESIITASNSFLAKYNIDTSSYGAPQVDKSWKIWYARSAEMGQEQMVPDTYTVTYPTMLDGKIIYQEGGMYRGLTLNYDIRTKRVTGMYGIEKADLKKSSYETIKDKALISKMIKNGGRYIMPDDTASKDRKVVELTLGEPTLEYVDIYGEWRDGKSEEYYVPAYVFPVENPPKEGYVPATIIVPLVEEFVQTVTPMDPIIYSTKAATEPALIKQ